MNKLLFILSILPLFSYAQTNDKGVLLSKNDNKVSGKTWAVIVGVSEYRNLPQLNFADKDAYTFYSILKKTVASSDTDNLFMYLNSSSSRDIIVQKLTDITGKLKRGDRVFFYFSGHGDMEQLIQLNNCLLLLSNSPKISYLCSSNSYLDIGLLKNFFQTWSDNGISNFFICDACHSGSLIGGEQGRNNTLISLKEQWNNEIKILSCQPEEVSLEGKDWGGGRGLFSFYFTLGFEGLADQNSDNKVSLLELQNYVTKKVSEASKQNQFPVVEGNLKTIISSVSSQLKILAAKESGNDNNDYYALSARGGTGEGLSDLIKDSALRKIYLLFLETIKKEKLTDPEGNNAYYYFSQFQKTDKYEIVRSSMRIILIESLQKNFEKLLDNVYSENYLSMGIEEKFLIEKQLNLALQLTDKGSPLARRIQSKIYFYMACEASIAIEPGSHNSYTMEKLQDGIDLLNKALKIDSLSPCIYLKLGDYYLYSNKFSESIKAYTYYQQLVPNDAHSYNKLGLAYIPIKQFEKAIACFQKSLKIDPEFEKAKENLSVAQQIRNSNGHN